ncbi:MAG: carboxypeptidase regulatory-like domain-containing protein [Acidobacteriota bacterium]
MPRRLPLFSLLAPALLLTFAFAPLLLAGSVSGRLLDASGKPVAGAPVRWTGYRDDDRALLDATNGAEPAVLGETATGADGRFRISIQGPAAAISLRIAPPGSPTIRLGGPFDGADDVALDDLRAGTAAPLSGRVVDAAGKGIAGAKVRVIAADPFSDDDAQSVGEGRSGADGAFSIPEAPAGERVVETRASGLVPAREVQSEARPDTRIVLQRGGTIHGVVLDPGGKPAAGALVVAEDLAAETDAAGTYRLAGIPPGVRAVEALWKEDFAARRDALRIRRGEETDAPMRLARAAAIDGTVIDETTRKPIAGARLAASSGGGFAFNRRRTERSARTDARGRYRLSGLASRAYTVSASREGWLTSSIAGVAASTAAPGTAHVALAKAASVAGRVVDESGTAVPGARVRISREGGLRAMMRRGPGAFLGRGPGGLSGPDGAFRIRNLAAGRSLSLEAEKTGYAPAMRPGVTLRTGEAAAGMTLILKKGIEARGRVVDAEGKPVRGAEVRVAGKGAGFLNNARAQIRMAVLGQTDRPDATSAADGTFVVRGLSDGEYSATASRDGYARKTASGLMVQAGKENLWPPITLSPGVAITGFVRDTKGQPIPGAQIFGISIAEGGRPQITTADLEGRFRVDGLAAEKQLLLNVSADGYASTQKNATAPAEDVAVVLKSAGTLRGRVEDGDSKRPVTDFTISLAAPRGPMGGFRVATGGGGRAGGNSNRSFQAEDGSFELPDVPPGKWTVTAAAAGYRNGETSGVEVGEGETKEGIVIGIRKGGSLSGRVLDPASGAGLPNASVSWQAAGDEGGRGPLGAMFGGNRGTATSTDADGRFHFDGLAPGRVTVTAEHADYLEASREVDPDKESSVDITLGTGGSISGSVVGKDGRMPAAGALVSLDPEGDASGFGFGGGGDSTRTDGSGRFQFDHLGAGRYKLAAESASGKTAPKEVVLAESQRQDGILLSMNASGARIRGTVSGLPAAKLGGVRVFASGQDYNDTAQTDDAGAFTLNDVPAGVVRFSATTSFLAGRSASKNLEVPDGAADVPVEIVFEGTSRIAGRVTRANQPLSGLFVSASPDPPSGNGGRGTGQTDENGQYAIEGLSDGTYQLNVMGQGAAYHKTLSVSGDTIGDVAIPAVTISGLVTEEGSGDPIEGASIQAETGQESVSFSMKSGGSDSSGHYEVDGVDPGSYQVSARKAGYELKTQTVSVGSDPVTANFTLSRGAGLTIRAADGLTGLPMRGLSVLAFSASGGVAFQGSISLDATGKGEVSSLSPGRYSLYLFADGYAARALPSVDVPSPTATVTMTPGGRVDVHSAVAATGRVTDGSGAVYLMSPFRLDGRVSVAPPAASWDHFAPGHYTLTLAGGQSYPFDVHEGQTTRIDLR